MIVKSLDGVEVDITHCDAGHPPDSPKGCLNLNTTAVWIKPAGGEWIRSRHRSAMVTCHHVKHTNVKDLLEVIGEGTERISSGDGEGAAAKLQTLQGHSAGDADKHPAGTPKG